MIQVGPHRVLQIRDALAWRSALAIDADGAYRAYHPDSARGLDRLSDAVDLLRDPTGNLVVQGQPVLDEDGTALFDGSDQPAPGFYVSPNLLVDHGRNIYDARRYGDAETVAYLVRPPDLRPAGVRMLDVALVVHQGSGRSCSVLFGDAGNRGKLTEGSIGLAAALGLPSSARSGGTDDPRGIAVLAFPSSARGWPRSSESVEGQVAQLISDWGGVGELLRVVGTGVE